MAHIGFNITQFPASFSLVQNIYLTYNIHHKHLDYTTSSKYIKGLADASYFVRCWTKMSVICCTLLLCSAAADNGCVLRQSYIVVFNHSK